jgi:cysteine desulfurase family protein (TIGR01976 family)
MTQVTYDMARTLAKSWSPGDEVVVTRLEHDANLRPWLTAAESVGVTVRWVDFDPDTTELPPAAVAAVLTDRTRLVAVTGASNLLGTRPDLPAIAAAVHAAGALLYVDGVHLTPHAAVDIGALGADFFTCSPYKFCGPHLGVLAASPSLLATLHPDKLLAATDDVPERFELGTLPYEQLAGVTAAVDFLAGLIPQPGGSRRARLLTSLAGLEEYERGLLARLEAGLSQIPSVVKHSRQPIRRTPTVLFSIRGANSSQVSERLAESGVNAPAGCFYAIEPAGRIGLPEGAVRASLAPYSTTEDIDRLITAVADVAGKAS